MPTSTSPSGGEVDQLNARIAELEVGLTEVQGVVRMLQEQSKNSMQQGAPTAPSGGEVAELKALIFDLAECTDRVRVVRNHEFTARGDCKHRVK
jgi:hypothetical protein